MVKHHFRKFRDHGLLLAAAAFLALALFVIAFHAHVPVSSEAGFVAFSPNGASGGAIIPASCELGDYHDAPYFGQPCTSAPNDCGQTNSGTYQCGQVCSAGTPSDPAGYGSTCYSSANVCGQRNTGTITCSGSCSVTSPPTAVSSVSLSPNAVTIDQGQSVSLTWSSTNSCTLSSCTFFDGPSYGGSGTRTVTPSSSATYGLSCTGVAGSSNSAYSNITVLVPTASISVNPTRVAAGNSLTVTWSATNVNACTITKNGTTWKSLTANGSRAVSGSATDSITTQTTYQIVCANNGSASAASASGLVNVVPGFQEF